MNYLPPPQPTLNKDIRVSGDVEIHPTASLASGVILQAAPGSKIIVGADVCVGMGAIVNAAYGTIEIDSGAILGSGVLIVGASKIGSNSCIGTSSTVFQSDIAPMTMLEPGSIVGDSSRSQAQTENGRVAKVSEHKNFDTAKTAKTAAPTSNSVKSSAAANGNSHQPEVLFPDPFAEPDPIPPTSVSAVDDNAQLAVNPNKKPVVGQLYINELLVTLFPHQKNSDRNS